MISGLTILKRKLKEWYNSKSGNFLSVNFFYPDTEHESHALEYAFDLLEVGCTGTIEIIPESFNKSSKKELKPLTTVR